MKKTKKTFKEKFLGFIHSEGFKKFKKILDFIVYGYALLITIVLVVGLAMPKKSQDQSNNSRSASDISNVNSLDFDDGQFYYLKGVTSYASESFRLLQRFAFPTYDFTQVVDTSFSDYLIYYCDGLNLYDDEGNLVQMSGIYATIRSARMSNLNSNTNYYPVIEEFGFFIERPDLEGVFPLLEFVPSSFPNRPASWHVNVNSSYTEQRISLTIVFDLLVDKLGDFITPYFNLSSFYIEATYSFNWYFNFNINYNCAFGPFNYELPFFKWTNYDWSANGPTFNFRFVCDGVMYKGLHFSYANNYNSATNGHNYFRDIEGSLIDETGYDFGYFTHLSYINMDNTETIVFSRNISYLSYENGSNTYEVKEVGGSWVSFKYRSLQVLANDSDVVDLLNNLNTIGDTEYNGYTSYQYYDVFSLIGLGFTSLIGLFNISLLPGITLGLLLFMPLMVSIIIIVVRMVKK